MQTSAESVDLVAFKTKNLDLIMNFKAIQAGHTLKRNSAKRILGLGVEATSSSSPTKDF